MIPYNKKLVPIAKTLRKNMTPEEKHMWYDFLKKLPLTVKRQHTLSFFTVLIFFSKSNSSSKAVLLPSPVGEGRPLCGG